LSTAVRAVLDGRIVNGMAVSGILAAERTLHEGPVERTHIGDLPWASATGADIPGAPFLAGAEDR